jgi:hypothetical protein
MASFYPFMESAMARFCTWVDQVVQESGLYLLQCENGDKVFSTPKMLVLAWIGD